MNSKITSKAIAKLEGKAAGDMVALRLRTTTTLSGEQHEQLMQLGGKLLYDSGIVAVVEIPAGCIESLAAWESVIEII